MLARRALNMNGLVMSIKGRQGPYGKGKGGQERQKGSEGKGKSSGKGKGKQGNFKGKQGKSPPGGVTFSLHRQRAAGTMATATPGTGMSAGAGFGDGTKSQFALK